MVNEDFVHGLVPNAFGLHNEPTLCKSSHRFISILLKPTKEPVIALRFPNHLQRTPLTILLNRAYLPIIEATFPELAEVDADLHLVISLFHDVPFADSVPCQNLLVLVLYRRRCTQPNKHMLILPLLKTDTNIDPEVLPRTPNNRPERAQHLPSVTVIEAVEQDDGLVAHGNVGVS